MTAPKRHSPGRPRQFDMDEMLDKAIQVFQARGYFSASISEIRKATGLTEGSLYKAFADKKALFSAAFERYYSKRMTGLQGILRADDSGRENLLAMLRHYANLSSGEHGKLGCLIVGSAAMLSVLDDDLSHDVKAALQQIESTLATLVVKGQADGSIRSDLDPTATAKWLWCMLLGMRIAGKAGRRREEFDQVAEQVSALLKQP
ncbi:TetR/AcrR family transcriptional regulator [Paludibacterium purpuratum]|nr:TetR/AcrR family transcriptional regulator [Paludibacterium purpuratum]